jgi:hypothetical protein
MEYRSKHIISLCIDSTQYFYFNSWSIQFDKVKSELDLIRSRDVTIPIPTNTNTPIPYWYCYIPVWNHDKTLLLYITCNAHYIMHQVNQVDLWQFPVLWTSSFLRTGFSGQFFFWELGVVGSSFFEMRPLTGPIMEKSLVTALNCL